MITLINILLQELPTTNIFDVLGGGAGGGVGGIVTYVITKYIIDKNEPKIADVYAEMDKREKQHKEDRLHDKNGSKAAIELLTKSFNEMGTNKIDKEQHDKELQWLKDVFSDQKKDHDKDVSELKTDIKELSTRVDTGFNEIKNLLINRP